MKTTAYKLKLYFLNYVVLNDVTSSASIQNEDLWYSLDSLNDFPHFNPIGICTLNKLVRLEPALHRPIDLLHKSTARVIENNTEALSQMAP